VEEIRYNLIKEGKIDDKETTIEKEYIDERYLGRKDRENIYIQNEQNTVNSSRNIQTQITNKALNRPSYREIVKDSANLKHNKKT
jgi:hypothetical protein